MNESERMRKNPKVHSNDNRKKSSFNRGFTLIEVMIVIAIIAGAMALGAPRLFNSGNQMRSAIRQLAVKTREIRNNSRLQSVTSRLVIRMDEEKGHSFWVESAPGNVLLLSQEQTEELEKLTQLQREGEARKSNFSPDVRVVKKPIPLPKGLFFESVEYGSRDSGGNDSRVITKGIAYIHFFPQGLSEEAMIHLGNKKTLNWSIYIDALTGRAQVFERKVDLKELRTP